MEKNTEQTEAEILEEKVVGKTPIPDSQLGTPVFHGIPTITDVAKLQETIPLEEGQEVTHEQIEKILRISRGTTRYRTVTFRWKKLIYEKYNKLLVPRFRVGWIVANAHLRMDAAARRNKSGVRQIVTAKVIAVQTADKQLTAGERKVKAHLIGIAAQLQLAEDTSAAKMR